MQRVEILSLVYFYYMKIFVWNRFVVLSIFMFLLFIKITYSKEMRQLWRVVQKTHCLYDSDANTDIIILITFQLLTVSVLVPAGNLSIFSRGLVDGVYDDLNLLNSALQAKSVQSNWTLLDMSFSLPLKHEVEGDLVVVDTFQASSSCLQVSNLYQRSVLHTTSKFLATCSMFLELSEGLIIFLLRK